MSAQGDRNRSGNLSIQIQTERGKTEIERKTENIISWGGCEWGRKKRVKSQIQLRRLFSNNCNVLQKERWQRVGGEQQSNKIKRDKDRQKIHTRTAVSSVSVKRKQERCRRKGTRQPKYIQEQNQKNKFLCCLKIFRFLGQIMFFLYKGMQ